MLVNLRLRWKLLLLALVPMLLLAILLSGISMQQLQRLALQQQESTRASLIRDRRAELTNYVTLARNTIAPLYEASADGDMAARDEAILLLERLSYGEEGYFWAYDDQSVRVMHGNTRQRIGESYADFRDPNGVYAIRDLVRAAQDGSHYVSYSFEAVNTPEPIPKIGYAWYLPKWRLAIGTSLNLDGVDRDVALADGEFHSRTSALLVVMLGSTLFALAIIAVLAVLFSNSLLRPLLQIRDSLDDMAAGEGDLTRRLPVGGHDELGELAGAFNRFVEKIQALVQQVAQTSTQMGTLVAAVDSQAQRSQQAMDAQRQETEQVATAINEMSAAAHEVAMSAQRAAEAARETDDQGQQASRVVSLSVEQIHALVEELRSSGAALAGLQ